MKVECTQSVTRIGEIIINYLKGKEEYGDNQGRGAFCSNVESGY